MFFWNPLAFSMIQWVLAIWSLVPLPFLNRAWTTGISQFTYCWEFSLENFEHYFVSAWDKCSCEVVWTFFGIAFPVCGHCWVFQICWHIECSTFTASSFRIWNNSAGIPSPPLALFIVKLPKALLTLHSRMSGFRWVITPSWLSGSWRSFLYSSSMYSCHLFLISSASVSPYHFCPLLCPCLHEMFPWHL